MPRDKNFERALDVVQRLHAGQRLTARRLSGDYDVSLRTAQRIMSASLNALPVRRVGTSNTESYLVWVRRPTSADV